MTSAPGARWKLSEEELFALSGLPMGWGRDLAKGGELVEGAGGGGWNIMAEEEEEEGRDGPPRARGCVW